MSDDIVKALRELYFDTPSPWDVCCDAADEIERLRAELAAERDKLREQYEEAIAANMRRAYELAAERLKGQMRDRNDAERDALRALLREAREWIVEGKVDFNDALADRIDAALMGDWEV